MKKGGYQILELNCEGNINILNDYKNLTDDSWVNIKKDFDYNKNSFSEYLDNLFNFNKTCLIKNLLVSGIYLTFFTQMITGVYLDNYIQEIIYVVDSSNESGYTAITSDDYYYCLVNSDYVLLIDGEDCTAIIVKLYKGAITQ